MKKINIGRMKRVDNVYPLKKFEKIRIKIKSPCSNKKLIYLDPNR